MSTFFRKSPFFIASIVVHLIIFALITLRLNAEIIKEFFRQNTIIEVEVIKSINESNPLKSVIDYRDTIREDSKLSISKDIEVKREDRLKSQISETKSTNYLNLKPTIPERKIIKAENNKKANPESDNREATITSRILYRLKSNPDIKIKGSEMLKNSIKVAEKSHMSEQESSLRVVTSKINEQRAPSKDFSEQLLSQDYELVRRMIEEKANKFVPVIYQKKLLEKKKRTAIVEMTLSENGYVNSHIIRKSTGIGEMDRSIRAILHLAEPYVYVPKPVNIELIFYE
ncbi:MAG: hypothetical protein ACP5QK_06480 [Myxococcota bacterium]